MSVKLSLGAILVCSKSSFLNWFLWSNVCLYPQEMASSLAQKHLRSIILNVSIKSETQTLKRSRAFIWWLLSFPSTLNNSHWNCQELLPIKLPKTLVIHNTCVHPPLRLYSVGVWWWFRPLNKELVTIWKVESFTHRKSKCDMGPSLWSGTKSPLKMIPFGICLKAPGWTGCKWLQVRKCCTQASWNKEMS